MIRGVCPSLNEPMATGDGLLVRLQLTEPALTPEQARGLAEASRRHSNGLIEITTRGNIQLRGLQEASISGLTSDIDRFRIGHQSGPAVAVGPLAGIDPQERADPRPLAADLRAIVRRLALHPKTSLIVESGGQFSLDALTADIRITAARNGVWQIALAGNGRDAATLGLVQEDDVPAAIHQLLLLLQRRGSPIRLTTLLEHKPVQILREALALESVMLKTSVQPGRAENVQLDVYYCRKETVALFATTPFGQLGWQQMATLANLAENAGADLRPAPGRAILLAGAREADTTALRRRLAELGFIIDSQDPRCRLIACAGAPACASAHIETRNFALALLPHMPAKGSVHVSGCAKGCAHVGAARLTLVGLPGGQIALGSGHPRHMNIDEARLYSPAEVGRALAAVPANEEETS